MDIAVARDIRAAALALDAGLGRLFEVVAQDEGERAALSRAVGDIMGLIDRDLVLAMERLHPGLAGEATPPPG